MSKTLTTIFSGKNNDLMTQQTDLGTDLKDLTISSQNLRIQKYELHYFIIKIHLTGLRTTLAIIYIMKHAHFFFYSDYAVIMPRQIIKKGFLAY